jgi:competence CoiA-like predicted nuclease
MLIFAQDEHGQPIHIDNVKRGKACNCRYFACHEKLIARQGNTKAHSFAHVSGIECRYALDAMLN